MCVVGWSLFSLFFAGCTGHIVGITACAQNVYVNIVKALLSYSRISALSMIRDTCKCAIELLAWYFSTENLFLY